MEKIRSAGKIFILSALVSLACGVSPVNGAEEDGGKWDKAGKEVKEAAGAVTDATRDSSQKAWQKTREESGELYGKAKNESGDIWDKTKAFSRETWEDVKEGSEEAWEFTKEESKDIYERAKAKIHDVTAPEQEGEPHPE